METLDFLRAVWPDEGYYCIVERKKYGERDYHVHTTFGTVEGATSHALAKRAASDVYFTMFNLTDERVWNPNKKKFGSKDLGNYEVRTQANAKACRCFFADLDVGESTERVKKYPTRADALAALKKFLQETGLPRPFISSSGRGLHVFWPLTCALEKALWKVQASRLKRLFIAYGLFADPSRVEDESSVLRVPGTLHLKDPSNPQVVQLLLIGVAVPADDFVAVLDAAMAKWDVGEMPVREKSSQLFDLPVMDLESNTTEALVETGPAPTLKALVKSCAQFKWLFTHQDQVNEPMWYLGVLNTVRFTQDGDSNAHIASRHHPHYDKDKTDAKLQQLKNWRSNLNEPMNPTTCGKMASTCGPALCQGCPNLLLTGSSPIALARKLDTAAAPKVTSTLELDGQTIELVQEIPDPPAEWRRVPGGGIELQSKSKDGTILGTEIYPYDLYPYAIVYDYEAKKKSILWRTELPLRGTIEFATSASQVYDSRELVQALSHSGVFVHPDNLPLMRAYMVAYIQQLERYVTDSHQHAHLGWSSEYDTFIMPDVTISATDVKASLVTPNVQVAAMHVKTTGTFEAQRALMDFYKDKRYTAQQFMTLCGLAAPLFHMTGHEGIIVNATGKPGASKSTALSTAASFWAHPSKYLINGTDAGDTARARSARVHVLANLPVCVDEITAMDRDTAKTLALSITQPGDRGRLNQDGSLKATPDSNKSTLMLCTANTSLHELLSASNAAGAAGSMRVFEMGFVKLGVHEKHEADDYLSALKHNYGHIGPRYMRVVVRNYEAIKRRVKAKMKHFDSIGNVDQAERFWGALAACVVVAGEIAVSMNLLAYDIPHLETWIVQDQLAAMRTVVSLSYADPIDTLMEYVESVSGDVLLMRTDAKGGFSVHKGPSRELKARHEIDGKILWVTQQGFKDYCYRRGVVFGTTVAALQSTGVIKRDRITLGRGSSDYAHGQVWTLRIDMRHHQVTGRPELKVIEGDAKEPTPKLATLRPVIVDVDEDQAHGT